MFSKFFTEGMRYFYAQGREKHLSVLSGKKKKLRDTAEVQERPARFQKDPDLSYWSSEHFPGQGGFVGRQRDMLGVPAVHFSPRNLGAMAAEALTTPPLSWSLPAAFIHYFNKYLLSIYHHVPGHSRQGTDTNICDQ